MALVLGVDLGVGAIAEGGGDVLVVGAAAVEAGIRSTAHFEVMW